MQNHKPWQIPTFDVFVGNLPGDIDQKKVSKSFCKFGELQAVIVRDSNTDGKKLAYVKFLCQEDADKAVAESRNLEICGAKVVVRRAESRKKLGDRQNKDDGMPKGRSPMGNHGNRQDQNAISGGLQKDSTEDLICVTHVESGNILWAQIVTTENMQKLMELSEQCQTLFPAAPPLSGTVEINKMYGAKFSEDQQWYRCKVKQSLGTDRVKVLYLDYGNTEEVNPSNLVEIPGNIAAIKPFATRLVFNNIRVHDVHCKKTVAYLKQTIEGKSIRCVMKRKLADQSGYFAEIYVDGEYLNDKMVEAGFASHRLEMKRDGGTRGGGGPFGHPGDREIMAGYADKGAGDGGSFPPRSMFDQDSGNKMHNSLSSSGRSTPNSDINHISGGGGGRGAEQQQHELNARTQELHSKTQELQRVKFEKDKINGELTNLKSRMKVLQNEFSSVSTRMMETSVNNQFQAALELAGKVKKLRCQFPCLQKTPLDDALDLVRTEGRIDTSSVKALPDVLTALSKYRGAQKEISLLQDMGQLESLVEVRNCARGDTIEALKVCISELNTLPLSDRAQSVGATLTKIRKYYDSYFKFPVQSCPPLDALMPTFIEWKEKRMSDFVEARGLTDSYQQATMTALNSVQSQLSFANLDTFEQTDYDLETLLRQYINGLQHEVQVTDAEHSSDAGFLAALVQSLFKELQGEMTSIENYQRLLTEFQTMKSDCEPWLKKKPCTEELQGVRKTLRGLKSKLRHRIADRQDLEENEDGSSELSEIKKDISAIRTEIHQAHSMEDRLINDLAKIADMHFPELMKIHPEMGIDIHLEYNGLVKASQEIDHFDLGPAECASHGLFVSTFSGAPIFLREHLLSDGERLDKDDFTRRVVSYSAFTQDNLQPVKAVFFDKNARHAYIYSEKQGDLLSSIVEKGQRPHKKAIQQIIRCIAKALQALHAHNIVHGEVTPQNIVVRDEDGTVTLLEPDFSQTMKERSRKRYCTPSGNAFLPPELKNAMLKDVFPATDMFNLGMLILWLHYPDVHFGITADAPDFKAVPLDQSVQMVLSSLLNNLPHLRMTAEQLLSSDYLTATIPDREPTPEVSPEPEPEPECEPIVQQTQHVQQVLQPEPETHRQTEPAQQQQQRHQPVPVQQHDVMADIGTFTLDDLEPQSEQSTVNNQTVNHFPAESDQSALADVTNEISENVSCDQVAGAEAKDNEPNAVDSMDNDVRDSQALSKSPDIAQGLKQLMTGRTVPLLDNISISDGMD